MKKILIGILVLAVVLVAGYGIRYLNKPLNAVPAELMTHEAMLEANGFIARSEKIYYAPFSGTVYYNAAEGERVMRDAHVSTVYRGKVGEDILNELGALDGKISNLKKEIGKQALADAGSDESLTTENKVKIRMDKVYDNARNNNIADIQKYKEEINGLRTGMKITDEEELKKLEEKRNDIEIEIGGGKQDVYTELSGTFTSYIDGLESVLNPERIKEYTPSYIRNLNPETDREKTESSYVEAGAPVGKVINDHVWYMIAVADHAKYEKFKSYKSVKLRINNMAGIEMSGHIDYASGEDEGGNILLLIRCNEYLEDAFSYREAQADVIFESYTGYKVPIHAIRSADNKKYVVGASGINQYDCDCEILYTDADEGIALIRSTEDAEHKLIGMDRIIVGER